MKSFTTWIEEFEGSPDNIHFTIALSNYGLSAEQITQARKVFDEERRFRIRNRALWWLIDKIKLDQKDAQAVIEILEKDWYDNLDRTTRGIPDNIHFTIALSNYGLSAEQITQARKVFDEERRFRIRNRALWWLIDKIKLDQKDAQAVIEILEKDWYDNLDRTTRATPQIEESSRYMNNYDDLVADYGFSEDEIRTASDIATQISGMTLTAINKKLKSLNIFRKIRAGHGGDTSKFDEVIGLLTNEQTKRRAAKPKRKKPKSNKNAYLDGGSIVRMKDGTTVIVQFVPFDGTVIYSKGDDDNAFKNYKMDETEFRNKMDKVLSRSKYDKR